MKQSHHAFTERLLNISQEERRLAAALYSQRGACIRGNADRSDDAAAFVFSAFGVTRSAVTRARQSLVFWPQQGRLWAALSAGGGPDPYGIRKEIEAFAVFLEHGTDPHVASRALKCRHGVIASPDTVVRWWAEARAEAS